VTTQKSTYKNLIFPHSFSFSPSKFWKSSQVLERERAGERNGRIPAIHGGSSGGDWPAGEWRRVPHTAVSLLPSQFLLPSTPPLETTAKRQKTVIKD
jgi:hypothetical protein